MTDLLLQHLITTTLLAALVWTVCRLAKPSPAAEHVLWSLVMIKLLIPPMGEVGIAVPIERASPVAQQIEKTPAAEIPVVESEPTAVAARPAPRPPVGTAAPISWEGEAPAEPVAPQTMSTASIPSIAPTAAEQSAAEPAPKPIEWSVVAIAAWCMGALFMAAMQLLRWQRFIAQTSVSAVTPEWLQQDADAVARDLNCASTSVAVCKRLSTPAVAGVFRPRILVPQALLERLPRERWRALLAHELAHVKRRDTWWRAVELVSGVAWFWNPVYWFARRAARAAAEHACDAWVVWALPEERRAYADSLVDVSEWASAPSLPATAIGMSAASKSKLEQRLTSIVTGRIARRTSRSMRVAAAVLLTMSLPGWAIETVNVKAEDPSRESEAVPSPNTAPVAPGSETVPAQIAQVDASATPADDTRALPVGEPANPAQEKPAPKIDEELAKALDEGVSIEFDDEHVQTILEFLSDYVGVNIVLDYTVVANSEPADVWDEMDIVHIGPHKFRQPKPEHLGSAVWPRKQAVDGIVEAYEGKPRSVKYVLDAILPKAGMTYAVTPDCVFITVARPEYEIHDPTLETDQWAWLQPNGTIAPIFAPVSNTVSALEAVRRPNLEGFEIPSGHILDAIARIKQGFDMLDHDPDKRPPFRVPTMVVDASAIKPPKKGPYPKNYVIAKTQKPNLQKPLKLDRIVTNGIVPFVKLQDVPLKGALSALCRPLNLAYVAGPGFIYVSSQERIAAVDFADTPVPANETEIQAVLEQPVSIQFDNEYVGTICEFISDYVGVNIVLDSRAVLPENAVEYSDVGTNPVTDGIVDFVKLKDLRLADALKAVLTPLGLDYSFGPGYIWVSSPELLAAEWRTATAAPATEPAAEPAPLVADETRPAAVSAQTERPPAIYGAKFRRITRWEDSDPRVEVELRGGERKWLEIGDRFQHYEIADINVIDNEVVVVGNSTATVIQLSRPVEIRPGDSLFDQTETNQKSRYHMRAIPNSDIKLGRIVRWENGDPRIHAEFPDGERKWLEAGTEIGDARILQIDVLKNMVFIHQKDGKVLAFGLPDYSQMHSRSVAEDAAAAIPVADSARRPGPVIDGYEFRRITRWEENRDPRVGVVHGDSLEWYEIGQSAGPIRIEDIDVISNQVVVNSGGELRVLQLAWPVEESGAPAPRPKNVAKAQTQWKWTPIPYGGVKFGAIARWEDSRDGRVHVEFPDGTRKWLEEGDAIGNARIGGINVVSNRVIVRTPEGETRTFNLPRPIQIAPAPSPKPSPPDEAKLKKWTPVKLGTITFGRIARWEDSKDARVQIELPGGERKWFEEGQTAAGVTIVEVNVLRNRLTVKRNGKIEAVQLPWVTR